MRQLPPQYNAHLYTYSCKCRWRTTVSRVPAVGETPKDGQLDRKCDACGEPFSVVATVPRN